MDLAHYGISRAKDWLSVDYGTIIYLFIYLTCTMISGVDLAHHGISRAINWVSVDYGTYIYLFIESFQT